MIDSDAILQPAAYCRSLLNADHNTNIHRPSGPVHYLSVAPPIIELFLIYSEQIRIIAFIRINPGIYQTENVVPYTFSLGRQTDGISNPKNLEWYRLCSMLDYVCYMVLLIFRRLMSARSVMRAFFVPACSQLLVRTGHFDPTLSLITKTQHWQGAVFLSSPECCQFHNRYQRTTATTVMMTQSAMTITIMFRIPSFLRTLPKGVAE